MKYSNLHTHTKYCDGCDSVEDIVKAAIDLGMECIGFSGHSYLPGEDWCMSPENTELYIQDVLRCRDKYQGQIEVLCGIEQDYYSAAPAQKFDYIIGSVHSILKGGTHLYMDATPEILEAAIRDYYGGDAMALAEDYYALVGNVCEKTNCDIIGHFDLLTKFNEKYNMFDTANPRYKKAWQAAADKLIKCDVPFEINTGAISRGWRTSPYPAADIIDYIKANGGRFILTSDSHSKETLVYGFNEWSHLVET